MILLYVPIIFIVILIMAIVIGVLCIDSINRQKIAVETGVEEQAVKTKLKVNEDSVAALMKLGFKRKESVEATRKAMEKVGEAKVEVIITEALRNV